MQPSKIAKVSAVLSLVAALAASCGGTTIVYTNTGGGGTGGHGGTGGQSGCTTVADCPAPANACVSASCTAGSCGTVALPVGAQRMKDSPADCQDTQCDGNGNVVKVIDAQNAPVATNPCLMGTCDAQGMPGTAPLAAGAACASGLCDGAGACVACLHDADCPPGQACTASHACVPPSCTDSVQDGTETDVDCGGAACAPCPDGKKCKVGSDCVDKVCSAGLTCAAAVCADGVQNGNETDVDCGGACPKCGPNHKCTVGSDCVGGQCGGGLCTPDCTDGVVNGTETDVDCGGGSCAGCAVAKKCKVDSDCASNACDVVTLLCISCDCCDHQKDGNETDIDCGGGICPACTVGKKCQVDADCTSNACDALTLICVADPCADHRKDGNETDVDCGGGTCPACTIGKQCKVDSDCANNACDVALICEANPCADQQKDGSETDVDCGGGVCPACTVGKQCKVDSDCASNACDALTLICISCDCCDHQKDGSETDVDCGGGVCPACTVGKKCQVDADCTSNACNAATHLCQ